MTTEQKAVIKDLVNGIYLMKRTNFYGNEMYMLYDGKMKPQRYVLKRTIDKGIISALLKKDAACRITLDLRVVRKLHGNSFIKEQYKLLKHKCATHKQLNS